MAKTKGITTRTISAPTKVPPVWQIGILFPDGKKISKPRCTLNEILDTYFLNLDKFLKMKYSPEELFELYKKTYETKGIKIAIHYIDSWGHMWKGKCAWPKDKHFIEFLNKRINENI